MDVSKLIERLRSGMHDPLDHEAADALSALQAENERLKERIGPRGLEVVEIDGAGHYVNFIVLDEIKRLRAKLTARSLERDDLSRQLAEARETITKQGRVIAAIRDEDAERQLAEARDIIERALYVTGSPSAERARAFLQKHTPESTHD